MKFLSISTAILVLIAVVCIGFLTFSKIQETVVQTDQKEALLSLVSTYMKAEKYEAAEKLTQGYLIDHPVDTEFIRIFDQILASQQNKVAEVNSEINQKYNDLNGKIDSFTASIKKWKQQPVYVDRPIRDKDIPDKKDSESLAELSELINQGKKLLQEGQTGAAKKAFLSALKIDPEQADANTYYSFCLYQESPDSYAKEILLHCQKAVKQQDANELAHYLLASIYYSKGLADEAVKEYQKTLSLNPSKYEASASLGRLYFDKGNYSDALNFFQLSLRTHQEQPATLYFLALTQEKLTNRDDAIKSLNEVLELNPDYYQAYVKLAELLYENKDYLKALEFYTKANSIKEIYQNQLGIFLCNKSLNRNKDIFNNLLRLADLGSISKIKNMYYDGIKLAIDSNDWTNAIILADRYLKSIPEDSSIWYYKGLAHRELKAYTQAANSFNFTLKYDPDNLDAIFYLGESYYKDKKFDQAKKIFTAFKTKAVDFDKIAQVETFLKEMGN
jgi:tetratricopeptide (TPR) repeat protein